MVWDSIDFASALALTLLRLLYASSSFLLSLNADDKLWFNMSSRRWMYDLNTIRLETIQDDVVSHMTKVSSLSYLLGVISGCSLFQFLVVQQMTRLSKDTRFGLMMAACLGRKFNSIVLAKALKGDASHTFMQACIDCGGSCNHVTTSHKQTPTF